MKRAYSVLAIKSFDDEAWSFEGIASTPATDRGEDIVNPLGAVYKLPLPLLWQHGKGAIKDPVGWITAASPTRQGIPIKAQMAKPKADYPQGLKDELTGAWVKVRDGLVRGLSIGFSSLEDEPIKGSFGMNIKKWEWLELSAVTIPMNAEATITSIKSFDEQALRSASGDPPPVPDRTTSPPGASGKQTTGREPVFLRPEHRKMKTTQEQIAGYEAKRSANVARMTEIMNKSAEDAATLDAPQTEEYDGLAAEVKSIDAHLVRLREHEKTMIATAVTVKPTVAGEGAASTEGTKQVRVEMGKSSLPKGRSFVRFGVALARSRGNIGDAYDLAKQWKDSSPEVVNVLAMMKGLNTTTDLYLPETESRLMKTAIAAGNTTDTNWASPLVQYTNMASEFVELLRPKTIIGRLTGLHHVPFNIRYASTTSGTSTYWVGQGLGKPVSKMQLATNTIGFAKAAGIVVITKELAMLSSPAAEGLVQNDMEKQMIQFLDQQFIDPGVAAVANVSPASITNGTTATQSTYVSTLLQMDTDVAAAMNSLLSVDIPFDSAVWIMTPYTAMKIGMLRTVNGDFAYGGINAQGGTWFGLPVITSNSVPHSTSAGSIIVLASQDDIFLADEGGIELDSSQEASLEMADNPSGGAASLVSLWQNNLIGLRAERMINWQRRRSAAVTYIDNVHV